MTREEDLAADYEQQAKTIWAKIQRIKTINNVI